MQDRRQAEPRLNHDRSDLKNDQGQTSFPVGKEMAVGENEKTSTTPFEKPCFVTAYELAMLLKLSERSVTRLAKAGKIPAIKLGKKWRFFLPDVLSVLRGQRGVDASGKEVMNDVESASAPTKDRLASRIPIPKQGWPDGPVSPDDWPDEEGS